MMKKNFVSPEDLAKFSIDKSAVVLIVGPPEQCASIAELLQPLLLPTEEIVVLTEDADIFNEMEAPTITPAIGVWSAKGSLIGYREHDESISEFLERVF